MKKNKFIRFGKRFVGKDEISAINSVIKNAWIGTGNVSIDFEKKFRVA